MPGPWRDHGDKHFITVLDRSHTDRQTVSVPARSARLDAAVGKRSRGAIGYRPGIAGHAKDYVAITVIATAIDGAGSRQPPSCSPSPRTPHDHPAATPLTVLAPWRWRPVARLGIGAECPRCQLLRAITVASNIPLRSGDHSGGFVMADDLRHRHAHRPGARLANGGATNGGRMWVSVR